eukprot:GEMP01060825.1.p1 GENE.GEMP01060825.1~~GEMP01060825.1.p1  ORF type:complete len:191 (+),score=38.66 GEMP01060825.1:74-574(+)
MIAATKAVAKAIPKAWAAKAKAFAAAKAAMPLGGPPQPRQALEDCLDNMDGAPTHRALRARAHAAPAKAAKAKAKANPKAGATGPGGHLLDAQQVVDVIDRVDHFTTACYKATFPLRAGIKRQRDGQPTLTKIDAASNAHTLATHLDNFDAVANASLEDFLNNNNL